MPLATAVSVVVPGNTKARSLKLPSPFTSPAIIGVKRVPARNWPFQLMRSVAIKYGLRVNRHVDERTNMDKAAVAASRFIQNVCVAQVKSILDEQQLAYKETDMWFRLLVLHAYHAGPGNVRCVINTLNPQAGGVELLKRIWQTECRGFKNESQNYSQIALATMLYFDQIISQVAKVGFRTGGSFLASMVIRIPFGGGIGAVEHHSESPEAQFAHIPGLKVVACSNPDDAYWMIQQAIACDDPVIFFEPKRRYWEKGEVDTARTLPDAYPLFASRVVRTGGDMTVAAYGPMVRTALEAAQAASAEGRELEVIDLRTLSPLDLDPVFESVRRTGRLVVVHEAARSGGLGAEVAARVTENCFYSTFTSRPLPRRPSSLRAMNPRCRTTTPRGSSECRVRCPTI